MAEKPFGNLTPSQQQKLGELRTEQFSYRFILFIGVLGLAGGIWMLSHSGNYFYDNYQFANNSLKTNARVDRVWSPEDGLILQTRGAMKAKRSDSFIAEVRYRINNDQDLVKTNISTKNIMIYSKVNSPGWFFDYVYADVLYLKDDPRKARFEGDDSYKNLGWNNLVWAAIWFVIGGGGTFFARSGLKRMKTEIGKFESRVSRASGEFSTDPKTGATPANAAMDQLPTQVMTKDGMPDGQSFHEMRTEFIQKRKSGEDEPEL